MVGSKLAHYKILEKIGAGGMGEVYRARDTKLKRDVALKVLPKEMSDDDERRKRFQREATAIASLKHPNIVTIYSVEEAEGHHFLTMELVEGKTLAQLLPRDGFPLEQYFKIAIPLAEAINSAHVAGITHRDLKPANVMIDPEGRVKVLDFGLAKLLEPTDEDVDGAETLVDDSDTQEGRVVGTVAYMSPEQAEGKAVDTRSDIFSLGVLLYEMATGERPFKGDSSLSLLSSILKDTPTSISEVRGHLPVQLGRIVQHCLEKEPRRRFQSALDVANELEALKLEVSSATGSVEAIRPARKPIVSKKIGIGGGIALVLLVAFFIINPFKVNVSSDQSATAAGNTLAIMYFENIAEPGDPKRHGEIVAELLITGLSESRHLSVVSSQRLYDLLKQVGKEGDKRIDRTTATDVATRAGARWMMEGRILQADPTFVITSQIVEVATGNVAASQRTTGRPGETIFSLVDRITDETLQDLSVPVGSEKAIPPVAEMSTTSEEAYRYYLEGIEDERKFFSQEARECYRKALDIDSTFAMAAYRMAVDRDLPEREVDHYVKLALRHADRASSKERLYLESARAFRNSNPGEYVAALEEVLASYPDDKHALERLQGFYLATGDVERSLEYSNHLLELDPTDKGAYNGLAYAYSRLGNLDKAIWALDKYIELAPDEPNPYDSRGDIYAENGRLDEAIASYAKAVEIKPDFADYGSAAKLGHMYLFKGDYDKAAAQYRALFASGDPRTRAEGRRFLYLLTAYRGHIQEAVDEIESAMATDALEGLSDKEVVTRRAERAALLGYVGEREPAVDDVKRYIDVLGIKGDFDRIRAAASLANVGAPELARPYIEPVVVHSDSLDVVMRKYYEVAKGQIAYAEGKYDDAIAHVEAARSLGWWGVKFSLARACFRAGRFGNVVNTLEPMVTDFSEDRIAAPVSAVLQHYYLGVAYQETGRNRDAAEQLETFLSIWKDADPRLEGLDDANQRLALLKQGS